jgi:putative ABC transport system substrate-binding protein
MLVALVGGGRGSESSLADTMNRRDVVHAAAAGLLAVVTSRSPAQQSARVWRIGVLSPSSPSGAPRLLAGLVAALRERGYDERSITLDVRAADGDANRLRLFAEELVAVNPDVILAVSPAAIVAARRATKTIPVVMTFWAGPGLVESGVIQSFARPGTNVTGLYMLGTELHEKRMQLLLLALPNAHRIALLDPGNVPTATWVVEMRRAVDSTKVEVVASEVPEPNGYDRVFEALAKARTDAVLIGAARFYADQAQIFSAAAKYRLPAMYDLGDLARAGGMMGYGPIYIELWRRAVAYIDRILKGADPASLPVEQPTRFEFVINLKTARALGLTLPQSLLLQADEVIE